MNLEGNNSNKIIIVHINWILYVLEGVVYLVLLYWWIMRACFTKPRRNNIDMVWFVYTTKPSWFKTIDETPRPVLWVVLGWPPWVHLSVITWPIFYQTLLKPLLHLWTLSGLLMNTLWTQPLLAAKLSQCSWIFLFGFAQSSCGSGMKPTFPYHRKRDVSGRFTNLFICRLQNWFVGKSGTCWAAGWVG